MGAGCFPKNLKQSVLMAKSEKEGSYIGRTMTVRGQVRSSGGVVIAGNMEGELRAESVELTAAGLFEGKLFCRSFVSSGRIYGVVRAESVQLRVGSGQHGRVQAGALELGGGVFFDCLEPVKNQKILYENF